MRQEVSINKIIGYGEVIIGPFFIGSKMVDEYALAVIINTCYRVIRYFEIFASSVESGLYLDIVQMAATC